MNKNISLEQLRKWRKEVKEREERSKMLSKKYGYKITLTDLNPHLTAERKFPKSAVTKSGKKIYDIGHANTRRKTIDVDYRVPKSMQHKVIKHEIEHIKKPRATEKQVRRATEKQVRRKTKRIYSINGQMFRPRKLKTKKVKDVKGE